MEVTIKINGSERTVPRGQTILEVLEKEGIDIPTMCYLKGTEHFPTCMICVVKEQKTDKLITSCSTMVSDGMDIISYDEEITEARKTALELLLSDHIGDCDAPCQTGCPAFMDIPLMNRLLAKGEIEKALKVAKNDIAIPAVLGRICPAPCERACRRRTVEEPVSICLLERFVGDYDHDSEQRYIPHKKESNGKKIGIIGTGPAGLSAAFFLLQKGYDCILLDKNPLPGGALRYAIPEKRLPKDVLDREIEVIKALGAQFKMNEGLTVDGLEEFRQDYDAVIIASGEDNADFKGLAKKHLSFLVDKKTFMTNIEGVFAIGSAIKPGRVAVRAVANGKEVALAVDQYLSHQPVVGRVRMFNSRFGKLIEADFHDYLLEAGNKDQQIVPKNNEDYIRDEAEKESARCMHCDCRAKDDCKLRIYSDQYNAEQRRFFPMEGRAHVRKIFQHDPVVYEPEKCIKCSICVKVTDMHQEELGLTYIGKGFDVEIGAPFEHIKASSLEKTAAICAKECPTGALALIDNHEQ